MALITGTVSDIGMQPLSGDLSVSSVEFRPEGDVLVAPEIRSFPIVAGVVNAELLTGPCRVTIRVGSHARRSFDVVVPNVASLSLAMLVETGFEYEPPVVSAVAGHRAAAEAARDAADGHADRAELAANSFDLTATATTGAAGSNATVAVTGDGPAYSLSFTVPRGDTGATGDKGDKGDTGTTEWSGINGKPSTFPPSTHSHADKADLVGGQVPTSQLPAIALTKPFPVADRAGMLALAAEEGDVAVVTAGADKGTYMLGAGPSTVFSSWVKLTVPDAPVQSVNGQTGTVNLNAANVGARPSSYVPAWSEITSKPATFPPTIGTTASTAKAGNYVPAWSEVTGKPATFPPATHTHTAADTGAVARQGAATGLWIGTEATLPPTGTAGVLYVTY